MYAIISLTWMICDYETKLMKEHEEYVLDMYSSGILFNEMIFYKYTFDARILGTKCVIHTTWWLWVGYALV